MDTTERATTMGTLSEIAKGAGDYANTPIVKKMTTSPSSPSTPSAKAVVSWNDAKQIAETKPSPGRWYGF